ncbi:hypothetical protein [Ensifer sp. SL37]|uniref:hypothetical protein n=1 Tax=Ensifer sp. SL37 TaxID=2995137 RepID=UPI0022729DA7|nr:hypothetical protein [Ensifer sp. SL37]MCY1740486.1 hypothetical protein [Ensifer sp. SL37]
MDPAADILFMLSSFNLRVQFVRKALLYGRAGVTLFPQDIRFSEVYACALLLDGQIDEAATVLAAGGEVTRNMSYLRARVMLQENPSLNNAQVALRAYLHQGDLS